MNIPVTNFICPICGCDAHVEIHDYYEHATLNNANVFDKNECLCTISLYCDECESYFDIEQKYKMILLEESKPIVDYENHNSNYGEGRFA